MALSSFLCCFLNGIKALTLQFLIFKNSFLFKKIKYMTQNVCKLLGQQLAFTEFLFGPRNYSLCLGIQWELNQTWILWFCHLSSLRMTGGNLISCCSFSTNKLSIKANPSQRVVVSIKWSYECKVLSTVPNMVKPLGSSYWLPGGTWHFLSTCPIEWLYTTVYFLF